jgi:hypothetical protein
MGMSVVVRVFVVIVMGLTIPLECKACDHTLERREKRAGSGLIFPPNPSRNMQTQRTDR